MSKRDPLCVCGCPKSEHANRCGPCGNTGRTPSGRISRCRCNRYREAIAQLSHPKPPEAVKPRAPTEQITGPPKRHPAKSSLARFEKFHEENPQVYILFKRFAFEAISRGRQRFSARTILHRIRWYTSIETDDPEGFKVNDHWSPFYSRLFVDDHPQHAGFFEVRKAIADDS